MPDTTVHGDDVARLKLKVVPGASRSEISGWLGDALKVRVTAAPEKGRANQAVEALLCRALTLPAGSVHIVQGGTAANKTCEVRQLSLAEIRRRIDHWLSSPVA